MNDGIVIDALRKAYGSVKALDGLSLTVQPGTVHAFLGPNGAGKTTAVRILSTLLRPDGGRATICGYDVTTAPHHVRALIALTGQHVATDDVLTGRENLILIGRLRRLDAAAAARRAKELIDGFELHEAADRPVRMYSGGTKRRLDLAMSLVARPSVLFLDEPTTSLDPRSRHVMWAYIERFARVEGTTVVLTTQYLEEADRLADHVSVIDRGKVIADGTPAALKSQASGDRVELTLSGLADLQVAQEVLRRHSRDDVAPDIDALRLVAPVSNGVGVLPRLIRELDEAGVQLADIAVRRPTLDDAFLALTGHLAEDQSSKRTGYGQARRKGAA